MSSSRTRQTIAPVTGAAIALTLILAGCSGGGEAKDSAKGDGASSEHTPGPLEEMWNDVFGEFSMDNSNAQMNRMEQAVAECMAAEGWEYTPVDHAQLNNSVDMAPVPEESSDTGPEWGTEEFAQQFGYGISTWEEAYGSDEEVPLEDGDEWVDPNQDYIDSLSATAQEAYQEALHGPMPTEEEMASEDWEWDPENSGCYGKAQEETFAQTSIYEDEKYKGLIDEMNLLYSSTENDPQLAEAVAAWGACMADAGYPGFADSDAARESLNLEMNAFWEAGEEPGDEALALLQEKEKAMAVADFACTDKARVEEIQAEAMRKAEQDFVDANRAELEEFLAAVKAAEDAAKG